MLAMTRDKAFMIGYFYFVIKSSAMAKITDYSELDEITHTLQRPDVYMGELNNINKELYTYDLTTNTIKYERVNYNTGLLKIFDEILTNAADNLQRPESGISLINVNITPQYISIMNNGLTIPIQKNEKGVYIPEMVFTHFRSGSNFNKRNKTTGGKNGLGAKLTSVYSSKFEIHIKYGNVTYDQIVENNCRNIHKPTIKGKNASAETVIPPTDQSITITFYPDFAHLKIRDDKISNDNMKVLFKRCHDLSHLPIDITINETPIPRLTWDEYVRSFNISESLTTYENDRWKVAFGVSKDKFRQISYVNNVCTYEGGEHVKYILNQLYDFVIASDEELASVTKSAFKQKIALIVYSIIDDPSFTSQAKETLSTRVNEFGTTCQITQSVLNEFIENTDIIEILRPKQLKTKQLKIRKGKITNIEKLVEANKAGTADGWKCTLFLCEGLSAKTMCDAGIGILGHNYYGCYPLRGKVLNTRNASNDKYLGNKEISDVKEIIGLTDGVEYKPEDIKKLRYGKVVCVKDADSDGADIMGLIINFFDTKFHSLLMCPGFFSEFISPMIKVVYNPNDPKKRRVVPFYNEVEYRQFMESQTAQSNAFKQFSVEFIKGLATNEAEDVKEYFDHYEDNCIEITFGDKYESWLDMAFNSKKADLRKEWLTTITPDTHLPRVKRQPIDLIDFIKNDLVLYSYDACVRSIPSMIDGLKPSQRKILYTLFKMGTKGFNKMKVFQLGGLVAKTANYHHGDQSMDSTIIGMAQTFTGSGNNVPLLKPSGSFGSRTEYGEDAGAPRYISCSLDKITRLLFPQVDDSLATPRKEDNVKVEPYYYVPIVPMILINGAKGIGTGWSTEIPSFNPIDCINYTRALLTANSPKPRINSFYANYTGPIKETRSGWSYGGIVEKVNERVWWVKELPIRYTTSKFIDRINYLCSLNDVSKSNSKAAIAKREAIEKQAKSLKIQWSPAPPIESFENHCAVEKIKFKITFVEPVSEKTVIEALGLNLNLKNTNMVAFDSMNQIRRYDTIYQIVDEWFDVRYETYEKRREMIIQQLEYELRRISNKCRFISENIEKVIDVKNISKKQIISILETRGYDKLSDKKNTISSTDESDDQEDSDSLSYDYLLNMKIYSLTKEKFEELKRKQGETEKHLNDYKKLTIEEIWLSELDALEKALTM